MPFEVLASPVLGTLEDDYENSRLFLLHLVVKSIKLSVMKKISLFSGKALAASFTMALLILLSINAVLSGEQSPKPIPDNVLKILDNSCGKCHNQGGSGAALANLNLTKWDNYDAVRQGKKAEAICRTITTGKMPPKSFIKKNPQAVVSEEQRAIICNWSQQ